MVCRQVDSEVRVPIFAIHDISAGTQLSYDYQYVIVLPRPVTAIHLALHHMLAV